MFYPRSGGGKFINILIILPEIVMNFAVLSLATLALLAGMILPVQFSINSELSRVLGGVLPAASISFLSGGILLIVLTLLTQREWPSLALLRATPIHIFLVGGLIGAIFVVCSVIITPRLGAAVTFCFIIAGQLISAILIDHFGAFNVSVQAVTPGRVLGALLVVAGALMVRLL